MEKGKKKKDPAIVQDTELKLFSRFFRAAQVSSSRLR